MSRKIDENDFAQCRDLARRRHDALVEAGRNPSLADLKNELFHLDGLRVSEDDVAGFLLGAPLDAGRRGLTGKSLQADAQTQRAAELSKKAESTGDPDDHELARAAHADARSLHRACATYHDTQVSYHKAAASPEPADASAAAATGLEAAKKVLCPRCGHVHDLSVDDAVGATHITCLGCGERVDVAEGGHEEFDENGERRDDPVATADSTSSNPSGADKPLVCPCGYEFALPTDQIAAATVTCPRCGGRVDVQQSTPEGFNENGQQVETGRQATQTAQLVAIDCARSLPSLVGTGEPPPNYIHYMPAGTHVITPSQGGQPVTVCVLVNEESAEKLEAQRNALAASGNPPFFSVQHSTQIAAFWPKKFSWDTRVDATGKRATGVWADGEWTAAGLEAVQGKNFRSFSPTFFVDKISQGPDDPAQVAFNPNAKLNMGALENDPAFQSIAPLWSEPQPRA